MGRFSVLIAVCLIVGLSDCQAGGQWNPEQTHEDPENNLVEKDASQTLYQGVMPTTVTPTQPSCEPSFDTVLKELLAMPQRLAATVKALEETNKKLEASDKKISELNSEVTDLTTKDEASDKKISELNSKVTELTTKDEATVKALEETNKKLEASDKKISELNSEVTDLTTKDEASDKKISELNSTVTELTTKDEATVKALKETNRKLEASDKKLSELNSTVTELTANDEATVKALEETKRRLEASDKKLSELNSTVTELTTKDEGVAFSTAMPVDGTIGPYDGLYPLVYSQVLSNIGGHYNSGTGYFTAPVPGVYYFTFTSLCWSKSRICRGALFQNETQQVSWYDEYPSHPTSASNSAVLKLQAGDKVNVRLWSRGVISDDANLYSSFSGFLLFPL